MKALPLNSVPLGKWTAAAVGASASAAWAAPPVVSTAPAAAVPEYPSSERLEMLDMIPSGLSCAPPDEAVA